MSFFSEQESGDLREAREQIAQLVSRELELRAEVERLRGALREISKLDPFDIADSTLAEYIIVARAALAPEVK